MRQAMTIHDERLRMVAYHQAGHVIAALRKRIPVDEVTLAPDESDPDIMRNYREPPFCRASQLLVASPSALFRLALVNLAGTEAEDRHAGHHDRIAASRERREARRLLSMTGLHPDEIEAMLALQADRARRLVAREWRDVETIARSLLERRTLSEDDVQALLPMGG